MNNLLPNTIKTFEDLCVMMNVPITQKEMAQTILRLRVQLEERGRFIELARESFHNIAKHTQPLQTCSMATCVEMRKKLLETAG